MITGPLEHSQRFAGQNEAFTHVLSKNQDKALMLVG